MSNSMIPHIEIRTRGTTTHIFIDGKELNGVRKVSFIQDASEASRVPILQFELDATDMVLNVKRVPELPEVFKEWYVLKNSEDAYDDKNYRVVNIQSDVVNVSSRNSIPLQKDPLLK